MSLDLSRVFPYFSPAVSPEDTMPLHRYGSGDGPVQLVFSTTLVVNYMIDDPGPLVFVRERDVERDGREGLHGRAVSNLRTHLTRRKLRFESSGSLHIAKLDGQHDASILLLDELWDPPTRIADVTGDLVVAVPARSTVLFTDSKAPNALKELRRALIAGKDDRALSPELFARRNGAWAPFD